MTSLAAKQLGFVFPVKSQPVWMRAQTSKKRKILLAAAILRHCPVAVPGCHNNLSYAEQGSMNLTCLSASVALFHRQNVGQGTTTAKGPTNLWLHNSPNMFAEVPELTRE